MDTIKAFFPQNQGTIFDFQKRAGEASPLRPLVAHLNKLFAGDLRANLD